MALTEIKCRNATPNGTKTKKYFDGGGLCLLVDGQGRKYWRLFYRMPGSKKQQVVSFGAYPKMSLKDARLKRDEVKLMIAEGIDPKIAAKQVRMRRQIALENTFADVARRWVEDTADVQNWSEGHKKRSKSLLERFFIPRIGDFPTSEIEPMQVLSIVQAIQARGTIPTSHKALDAVRQVFSYAMALGLCKYNPAADIDGLIKPEPKSTPYRHITDPDEIGRLLVALDEFQGSPQSRTLAILHPLIFTRPTELRTMRWDEIDTETQIWERGEHPDGKRRKNMSAIPFSRQAWALVEGLRPVTGRTEYVFCNLHRGLPLSEGAERKVLKSVGYHSKITPHGWRHTASTLLHDRDYESIWVEKQLGHKDPNKTRDTYNHAGFIEQRRRMLQEWADYLDGLKAAVR